MLKPVSCNKDCGGGCPLTIEYKNNKPAKLVNNPLRPDKDINLCAKGANALLEAHSKQRLTKPKKRTGERGQGKFIDLSWDDALNEIARGLCEIKNRYGTESLISLIGTGSCRATVHNPEKLARRFFSNWGSIMIPKGWYSNTASAFAVKSVFGTEKTGQDPETLIGAKLVILWGANISETRFGAKLEPVLRRMKKSGVPFYVIDPRFSRTAGMFSDTPAKDMNSDKSKWLAINPGTDSALMAAILFRLIENNQVDRQFIKRYTTGFDELESWITGKQDNLPRNAKWASDVTGISENQISNLARDFGAASPAVIIPGLSIQRTLGGEEACRMSIALQAARGNIGIRGGSPGACLWGTLPKPQIGSIDEQQPLYKNLEIPVNKWQEAENIKCIYSTGSNYVQQSSNQNKTLNVFKDCELSVCHDMFMTATALWSDYILPTTHFLERNDVVTTSENYLYFSTKVTDPPGEARDDYQIFSELAKRLGFYDFFTLNRNADDWLDANLEQSEITDIKEFKQTGIFDGANHNRITLSRFINDPESHPLNTPSGKINFLCKENRQHGYPLHPHFREENDSNYQSQGKADLQLITSHGYLRTNSQHSQLDWVKKKEYPLLHMNETDAKAREISDSATVAVQNEHGKIILPVEVSQNIKPGVVWALQGNWEEYESINILTSTNSTMPSHGSRTHSTWVSITRFSE